MRRWSRQFVIAASLVLAVTGVARGASDPTMTSNGYSVTESEVGGMGDFNGTSGHYSFQPGVDDGGSSLGESAVGNSSSANYQSGAGFNTTAQPGLTFVVDAPGTVNLGLLSTGVKTTGTATFHAINYTSYGYVITMIGTPPTNSGHPLNPLTTDTASAAGTEQFGVNLRANLGVGSSADPVQYPTGPPTFGYGVAGDGITGTYGTNRPYTVPDKWRFVSGETVASAPKSSGETDYTMTFLANMSTTTPGGKYESNITLVATGTY